jgi:hypothetical protein
MAEDGLADLLKQIIDQIFDHERITPKCLQSTMTT